MKSFEYLLVNRVPIARGRAEGTYVAGSMWLEDLRAEAQAIRAVGGRLTAALPVAEGLDAVRSGSFDVVEFDPADAGFRVIELPWYGGWTGYLAKRRRVAAVLTKALEGAEVVQMDASGHPMPLSGIVWDVAGRLGCRRVWVFDGGDMFGQLRVRVEETRNPVRRAVRRARNRVVEDYCRRCVREADLVFTHNRATESHLSDVWGAHCHRFDRSFIRDEHILAGAAVEERAAWLADAGTPFTIAVAARLIEIKGIDQVIRAVHAARAEADVRLEVLGDGSEMGRLQALSDELGLRDSVRFRGAVPYGETLFEALRPCSAMAITNLVPELSRSFLLAMALGIPIVAYENPGSDSMVLQSRAGVLVPRGDWRALAREIVALWRDRSRLARMMRAGNEFSRTRTLEGCHRARAELVAGLLGQSLVGAAAT